MYGDPTFEGTPRLVYGDEGATFCRVCPDCGRYVKADPTIRFVAEGGPVPGPTGTCKVHGRIEMPFEGFV